MLTVSEVKTAEEMERIRPEWDDLLDRSRNAGVFQTWEWLSSCRRHFGRRKRPMTLCVRDGDRLIGLAPLEVAPMYALPIRRAQFIGTGVSDYLDFIAEDGAEDAVADAIFSSLRTDHRRWDILDLQQVPANSCILGYRASLDEFCEVLEQEVCPYLPLAESWDEMLSRFGKKTRWNIRYYERAARREFEVSLGPMPHHELDEGLEAFFRLHTKRWRRRWLPGVLRGGRTRRFHQDVARCFSERDWLRMHGLRLDGELRAVLYCFSFRDKAYYYLGGFEPDLAKYSLGTVLTGHAIRDSIERGCREFDFLRGDEPYKARWTREQRTNSRLVMRKETVRSALGAAICALEHHIERQGKELLHRRFTRR